MEGMIAYRGSAVFAGWRESHNGPQKVVLKLPSDEALDQFKNLTAGGPAGQRLHLVAVRVGETEPFFDGETQLLGWSSSSRSGRRVVLSVHDLARWKETKDGTEMAVVCVEIGDDEKPVDQAMKGGVLAQLSGMLVRNDEFRLWLKGRYPDVWRVASETWADEEDVAADVIRVICRVRSRAELDHNEEAASYFHRLIRIPFVERHATHQAIPGQK